MKKIVLILVLVLLVGTVFAQEPQNNPNQQTLTRVQGNLTELTRVLGIAKSHVVNLEKNGQNTPSFMIIAAAADLIQKAKDLLEKYDYPNKNKIQQEVNDLEQRLFAVVMSL